MWRRRQPVAECADPITAAAVIYISKGIIEDISKKIKDGHDKRRQLEIHQYTSLLGLGFAFFHAMILIGDHYMKFTVFQLLVPFASANALFYEMINGTPGRVGPELDRPDPDRRRYFRTWLENDGAPFWSYWENIRTWWAIRDLPNVKLVHFADLKSDLIQELERQKQVLATFRSNPDIAEDVLNQVLGDIEQASQSLFSMTGKIGQYLRENEWLMSIKQRTSIPGGACELDRKSTRLNSSHIPLSRMPSSA